MRHDSDIRARSARPSGASARSASGDSVADPVGKVTVIEAEGASEVVSRTGGRATAWDGRDVLGGLATGAPGPATAVGGGEAGCWP